MEQHISRTSPVKISSKEFRETGYALIDSIAEFYETIARYPVTTGETPKQIDSLLTNTCLPDPCRCVLWKR